MTAPAAMTAWDLPPHDAVETARQERSTVIPVFLLAVLLPLDRLSVGGYPTSEFAAAGLCAWALTRRPAAGLRAAPWLFPVLSVLPLVLLVSGLVNDVTAIRRMLHVVLWCGFVYLIAVGRIHLLSLARGLAMGLMVGTASWFAGFDAGYAGRLTGLMADPNAAGMLFVGFGAIAIAVHHRFVARAALIILVAAGVLLTVSRTSMFALAIALFIAAAGRIGPRWLVLPSAGLVAWFVQRRSEGFRSEGQFADREGSDLLRARIAEVERQDVALSPWIGNGPGTARVDLDGDVFFYHSSYLAIRAEGGWLAYGAALGLVALAIWLLRRAPEGPTRSWVEAGIAGILVCALNLGEVLLAFPLAVALGAAFHLALRAGAVLAGPEIAEPVGNSG